MPSPARSRILLLIAGIVLLAAVSAWEHELGDVPFGSMIAPVSVEIGGLEAAERDRVQVTFLPSYDLQEKDPRPFEVVAAPLNGFLWSIGFRAIQELHITAPAEVLERIQSVHVDVGGKRTSFDALQFAAGWRPIPPFREALDRQTGSEATVSWPAKHDPGELINLRTRDDVLAAVARRAVTIMAVSACLCLLLIAAVRRRPKAPGGPAFSQAEPGPHGERTATWLALGFGVFCLSMAIARSREPYALTQDDNFSQFLPVISWSAKEFFLGHFPVWNPHQLLGSPTATIGIYMLTYPPTYLSYWIAKTVFGDVFLTIEIFTTLHLAAGYLVTFLVLRRFGLRPSLAAAGALSFSLSAFFLIGGRSQCTFVPGVVWLPLLAGSILALERGLGGWKWALATGAVAGIYFHAGHAQLWVYAMMFFAVAVLLAAAGGRVPWVRALWSIPALCFAVALAGPLLFLQMAELHGRHFGSAGTGVNLLGMLVPLGRWAPDIRILCTEPEWSGQLPYFGTTFAAAGLIGAGYYFYLLVLCKQEWRRARALIGEAMWLLLMIFAVALALGPDGIFWPLMANLPPFRDFRWPAKVLPFVVLFASIGGGLMLERWCARWRPRRAQWLVLATFGLIVLNSFWARASWYTFGDRPYPALDRSYTELTRTGGRILTRPFWYARSPAAGFFRTQALNFPSVTGALAAGGYDNFVESSSANRFAMDRLEQDPVSAARAYGVRWLIWDRLFSHPVFSKNLVWAQIEMPNLVERRILLGARSQGAPALALDGLEVYRLNDPDPLAFVAGPEKRPLGVQFDGRGATVDATVAPADSRIVVNVLWRPWMRAWADGRPVECRADAWGRVLVGLKGTAGTLAVFYRPPWATSSLAGLGIAALGGILGWLLQRWQRSAPGRTANPRAY